MEGPGDTIRSLGSLSTMLDSQITETNLQIENITKTARSLVPQSEYDKLTKEMAHEEPSTFDEDNLISELDKARLELLMDVQKQDFLSEKFQELINESEELVRSIIECYEGIEERQQLEIEASNKRVAHYTDDILAERLGLLKMNSTELQQSYIKVATKVHESLISIQNGHNQLLSKEYQEDLNKTVESLNRNFKSNSTLG